MRKILVIGSALAAALLIAACATDPYKGEDVRVQLTAVASTVTALDESYDEIVASIGSANFTDADKIRLEHAKLAVDRARSGLRAAAAAGSEGVFALVKTEDAKDAYESLRYSYTEVRTVVVDHKDDYTAEKWAYLVDLNKQAVELDRNAQAIFTAKTNADAEWAKVLAYSAEFARKQKESLLDFRLHNGGNGGGK